MYRFHFRLPSLRRVSSIDIVARMVVEQIRFGKNIYFKLKAIHSVLPYVLEY